MFIVSLLAKVINKNKTIHLFIVFYTNYNEQNFPPLEVTHGLEIYVRQTITSWARCSDLEHIIINDSYMTLNFCISPLGVYK